MSLCPDCVKSVRHEGTPTGKFENIGGVNCYVATPTGEYPKDRVLLYLADALGLHFNAQLLMDDYANNGYMTIGPDYLYGEPVPESILTNFDQTIVKKWVSEHTQERTRPHLDKVINALKEQGITKFAATGYCFGGRYVFDLSFEHIIDVAITSHPSLLKLPDLEKYASVSKAPLLINSCTVDGQFPPEMQAKADEILGDGKYAYGYRREYFEGCTHGFAVRGDLSDPLVKAAKEGAFTAAVEWLKLYF
ncbi:Alpha/Beta hydrolase fold [Amanita muscaria]